MQPSPRSAQRQGRVLLGITSWRVLLLLVTVQWRENNQDAAWALVPHPCCQERKRPQPRPTIQYNHYNQGAFHYQSSRIPLRPPPIQLHSMIAPTISSEDDSSTERSQTRIIPIAHRAVPLSDPNSTVVPLTITTASISVAAATASSQHATESGTNIALAIPSYRKLIGFCFTTMLIWLSEPLLSLVDTTVVGLTQPNAVVQIASLGPATTLYDSLIYLCYFVAVATTNQITKLLAQQQQQQQSQSQGLTAVTGGRRSDSDTNNYRQLQQATSHLLGMALLLGLIVSATLFLGGKAILSYMVLGHGHEITTTSTSFPVVASTSAAVASLNSAAATSDLLYFATRYVWVRATAATAAITGFVLQSLCLATMDTRTPTLAVLAASMVNIVGDVSLSRWGVVGAAMATACANWVSVTILVHAVHRKMQEWKRKELEQDQTTARLHHKNEAGPTDTFPLIALSASAAAAAASSSSSISNGTTAHSPDESWPASRETVPFVSLPDRRSFWNLARLSGPLFFVIVAKVICYSAVTLRCTRFGWDHLAAHNIMMRVFFFYGCFGDSVSQTAQSFIPRTLYPIYAPRAFTAIFRRLFVLAAIVGGLNSQISMLLMQRFGSWFTKDVHIVHLMKVHAPLLGFSAFWHPIAMFLEGVALASQNFRALVFMYVATMICHGTILRFYSNSFTTLWHAFCVFQLMRVLFIGWASIRTNRGHTQKGAR